MLKYTSPPPCPVPPLTLSPLTLSPSPHPLCKWFWLFRKLLTLQHLIARTTFVSLGCQCMKKSSKISKKKYVKHKKKTFMMTLSVHNRKYVRSAVRNVSSNRKQSVNYHFCLLLKHWTKYDGSEKKALGEGMGIQVPASMCELYESWVWLLILYEKNVWIANITK